MRKKQLWTISISLLFAAGSLNSCSDEAPPSRQLIGYEEYTLTVASMKLDGLIWTGDFNRIGEVYAVKREGEDEWQPFDGFIIGFHYEDGYEYQIRISKTDYFYHEVGDLAWSEYNLIKLLSKECKNSEGMPKDFIPTWYEKEK